MPKKKNQIVGVEAFRKFTKLTKELLDKRKLKINFNPEGIEEWTEDELDHADLAKHYGLTKEEYINCRPELYSLLFFRLKFPKKDLLKIASKDKLLDVGEKIKILDNILIDEKLQDLFNFHTNSKGYLFEHFGWEIIAHKGKGKSKPFSSAMVQIKIRNPSFVFASEDLGGNYITFECTKEDITEIQNELKEIRKVLK